jgi:hypothetical protein
MKGLSVADKNLLIRYLSMTDKTTSNIRQQEERNTTETLRNSLMVILTLIFVFLYAAAFSGKLDPLKDNALLLRFEPIIFLFIGYYLGRLPAWQSEKTLKDEITRQSQKADAAQYAKEKVQQERETLEEKIKNARTALRAIGVMKITASEQTKTEALKAVVSILDS